MQGVWTVNCGLKSCMIFTEIEKSPEISTTLLLLCWDLVIVGFAFIVDILKQQIASKL